jgi:hypothetical protein
MKIKVVVHEAQEGGFLGRGARYSGLRNARRNPGRAAGKFARTVEGCLSVDVAEPKPGGKQRVLEMPMKAIAGHEFARMVQRRGWHCTSERQSSYLG